MTRHPRPSGDRSGRTPEGRLLRILALMGGGAPGPGLLCAVCVRALDVAGAGVTVPGGDPGAPLCSSDAVAERLEELGFTLGEGPAVDAHRDGEPVAEPDLAHPRRARWPSFTPLAVDAGAAAIFAFPLRVGVARLGVLTLHRLRPGQLSDDQYADALALTGVVASSVLAHQAEAPLGDVATQLEVLSTSRAEVHQAAGMLSVQLEVSVSDALVRLRAHSYAEGRPLHDVAVDVVRGRLRLGR